METESLSPAPHLDIRDTDTLIEVARKYQLLLSEHGGTSALGMENYTKAMASRMGECERGGDPEQVLAIRSFALPDFIRGNLILSLHASLDSAGKKGYLRSILRTRESDNFPPSSIRNADCALKCALGVCGREGQIKTLLSTRDRIPRRLMRAADSAIYHAIKSAAESGHIEPVALLYEEKEADLLPWRARRKLGGLLVLAMKNAAEAGLVAALSQLLSYERLPRRAAEALPRALIRSMDVLASGDRWITPIEDLLDRPNLPPAVKRAAQSHVSSGNLSSEPPAFEISIREDGCSPSSHPPKGWRGIFYRLKKPKPDSQNPHKRMLLKRNRK